MTQWSELRSRERPPALASANQRHTPQGNRFSFVQQDFEIEDPTIDTTGRYRVSPKDYGFSIRGFEGGRTAWARDFANGTMLVMHGDGLTHVLSQRVPARIVFIGLDGRVLQDTAMEAHQSDPDSEQVTVRLVISASVALNGETPEAARVQLTDLIQRAVLSGPLSAASPAVVTHCVFELSTVHVTDTTGRADTDFSRLLDF
ncbi:MAG: hypothetical protein IPO43_03625 [Rhodoferax sp.]|nr:hypothetical protein [Rhodoferax sp.]